MTTATLAVFAGALSAFGAVYTARSFRDNRTATDRRHKLDLEAHRLNREAADRRHTLELEAHELDRAGQITERFTRAIDQLGNAEIDVRLGGIYALERIARDSKDDHPQVVEVLTAYVREHAAWRPSSRTAAEPGAEILAGPIEAIHALERIAKGDASESATGATEPLGKPASSGGSEGEPPLPTDVQAAMRVLGRRTVSHDRAGTRLNLARTDLRHVVLPRDEANLENAILDRADLRHASLLEGGNLQHVRLLEADLRHARLFEVNLQHADLVRADLRHASFFKADLRYANLSEADLRHASLQRADLRHAYLERANLQGARLDGANLQSADYDENTTWPEGFDPESAVARGIEENDGRGSVPPPD